MKRSYFVAGFAALFLAGAFLASCLNDDNKIPPNCYDGILNNDEFLLDCGGPNCPECNHCINGIFDADLGETCLDCGGNCGECPQCNNCVMDGDEVGIDCGGTFCGPCIDLCFDGILNGQEEEVDCGGVCEACPTCTDDADNGDEIGIDCGGSECPPCATDGSCANGIWDGEEWWTDCGINLTGFCEYCDTIFTWKVGGQTNTCAPGNITLVFNGTDLTVTGISNEFGTMAISIQDPITGWLNDIEIPFNMGTTPDYTMAFTDPDATLFTTGLLTAAGEATVKSFVQPSPGFIRLVFSGTFYEAGGTSVNISNGVLQYPLN